MSDDDRVVVGRDGDVLLASSAEIYIFLSGANIIFQTVPFIFLLRVRKRKAKENTHIHAQRYIYKLYI